MWEGKSYSPGKNSRVVKDSSQSAVTELGDTGLQLAALCLQSLFVPTVPLAQETHKSRDQACLVDIYIWLLMLMPPNPVFPTKPIRLARGMGGKIYPNYTRLKRRQQPILKGQRLRLPEGVTMKRTVESPTHLSGSLKSLVPLHSSLPSGAHDS